jgi:hypothetical protein
VRSEFRRSITVNEHHLAISVAPEKPNMSTSQSNKTTLTANSGFRAMNRASEGQFNARSWLDEGDHLYASAKALRAVWVLKRRKVRRALSVSDDWMHGPAMWANFEGLPKSSILLLGYSAEMYLKAGLAKAYSGCREEMFDHDVRAFSHDLKKLAKSVALVLTPAEKADLRVLGKMILHGARYPIKPKEDTKMTQQRAERLWLVWNKSEFTRMRRLVLWIKDHALKIDNDSFNPSTIATCQIDADGYLVYRTGGNLPPRVTFRYSTVQRETGRNNLNELRQMAKEGKLLLVDHIWDKATFHHDA